jgi:hypothetical protein
MDRPKRQTATATPAKPGGLPLTLATLVRPGGSCVSRHVAHVAVPFDRPPSAAIKMRIAPLSDLRALRRAHEHGAGSLPRVLGSGPSCSEIPHRGSRRRRSERRAMVLRSCLHPGVAPGEGRTCHEGIDDLENARIETRGRKDRGEFICRKRRARRRLVTKASVTRRALLGVGPRTWDRISKRSRRMGGSDAMSVVSRSAGWVG